MEANDIYRDEQRMLSNKQKRFLQVLPLPKQALDGTDAVNNELIIESLTAAAFILLLHILSLGEDWRCFVHVPYYSMWRDIPE
jgi:hypothetical protein